MLLLVYLLIFVCHFLFIFMNHGIGQVNTQASASVTDCSDHNNSKYYVVVVQVIYCFSILKSDYFSSLPTNILNEL